MIDHVTIFVSDLEKSKQFYERAFEPLGYKPSFGEGAALAAGAKDSGTPGPRPQYTPNYYAAFVLDFDGHNIETVFDTWDE